MLKKIAPKKFLCRYPLCTGAICSGIVLIETVSSLYQFNHRIATCFDELSFRNKFQFSERWDSQRLQCVSIICTLVLIAQVVMMTNCDSCSSRFVWRNAYSFSITGVVYSVVMLIMHIWMLWGVKKKKASVLLSWFVVTAMWLSLTFFLLIILLIIYSSEVNLVAWVLSFILGLIAIGVLTYFTLIVYGLWLELKTAQERNHNLTATANNN